MREELLPNHVAVIMDGNGRWAQSRDLPRSKGHIEGVKVAKKIIELADDMNIPYLTLFAFSTENWGRPKQEVQNLMNLAVDFIRTELHRLMERDIKLIFIGQSEVLPAQVRQSIKKAVRLSHDNRGMVLTVALNYGGRQDILQAVNKILEHHKQGSITQEDISEALINQYLEAGQLPRIDLLIRTGGERRLSNFLLWQLPDALFWTTDTLWPDFSEKDFRKALKAFRDYQLQVVLGPNR